MSRTVLVPLREWIAMRGLFIGRFQPFHEGHRFLIEQISDELSEVIVAIGSAERSHTMENPFTAGERLRMVQSVLDPLTETTYTVPVHDIDRNGVWVSHVTTLCPSFDVVYTNNPFVERLFEEAGIDVRGTPLHQREVYRGTTIRERMLCNEEWRSRVPEPVCTVIDDIDGVERLRMVVEDDTETV